MHRAFVQHPVLLSPSIASRRLSRSPVVQIATRAASTSNPAYSTPLSEQRARQAQSCCLPCAVYGCTSEEDATSTWCFQMASASRKSGKTYLHRDREASARRAALQEIVSELTRTISRNGQRGIQRTFQALQAAASISTEYVTNFQQGIQDPPQVSAQSFPVVPHVSCSNCLLCKIISMHACCSIHLDGCICLPLL